MNHEYPYSLKLGKAAQGLSLSQIAYLLDLSVYCGAFSDNDKDLSVPSAIRIGNKLTFHQRKEHLHRQAQTIGLHLEVLTIIVPSEERVAEIFLERVHASAQSIAHAA